MPHEILDPRQLAQLFGGALHQGVRLGVLARLAAPHLVGDCQLARRVGVRQAA
ncbi:MAG: hypothetical protein M5U05_12700 [Anaerolineales bacterium]|nr:hypothetical protein [Anaerolineales bacterium]